jgi:putative transposase
MFKKARKLQRVYDETKVTKPDIKTVCPELDGRFVNQDFDKKTSFDAWVTLTSLGNKMKIEVPLQRTKHFNRMVGERLKGIRLNKDWIGFNFAQPMPKKRAEGSILGIDIGKNTVLSCSSGYASKEDNHGWTLDTIIDRLALRKKGSKAFHRTQQHRTNHINWAVNRAIKETFFGVKRLNIEDIKNLRYGRKTNRKLTHWSYPDILDRLEDRCDELGVQVHRLDPAFTSQRCLNCGWVHKGNRKGKKFRCKLCGYTADADLNASSNLSLDLPEVSKEDRREHKKGNGFFWVAPGQENIIPDIHKI